MSNIKKNTQTTISNETTNNNKKRIPLRVLIPLIFTCFVRQFKRHVSMWKQNKGTSNKEKASKSLKTLFAFSIIILIIVIFLKGCSNTYYTSTGSYQKVEADKNQETIDEEPEVIQPTVGETEIDFDNHEFDNSVALYSKGNVANAVNNKVSVDVSNIKESSANMILEIYIPDDELISKIGTNGRVKSSQKEIDAKVEAAKESGSTYSPAVCVAKSGLIYPGNKITTLDLDTLEDGTVLPAGEYEAFYKETFYDDNGNLHSIDASLAITLVVQ